MKAGQMVKVVISARRSLVGRIVSLDKESDFYLVRIGNHEEYYSRNMVEPCDPYQTRLFSNDSPDVCIVTADNRLVLTNPSLHPTGVEATERKLARLREIEDRKAEKKGLVYA